MHEIYVLAHYSLFSGEFKGFIRNDKHGLLAFDNEVQAKRYLNDSCNKQNVRIMKLIEETSDFKWSL